MTSNIGKPDRIVRFVLGFVLLVIALVGPINGLAAVVVLIIGLVMLATATIRFCPLYRLLGIQTCQSR